MIIGSGLIARGFVESCFDHENFLFFASGVSNSKEVDPKAFSRERQLLINSISSHKILIYFSTCSIYDPELINTPYVQHKILMEQIIANKFKQTDYAIFRLPQVVGNTKNANTIISFLYEKIMKGEMIDIWENAKRYLIDIDDVVAIVSYMLCESSGKFINKTTDISPPYSTSIIEIVDIFELILQKKTKVNILNKGSNYLINAIETKEVAKKLGISFSTWYVENLLRKYYA